MNKREKELAAAIDFEATHWHVVVLRRDGKLKVRKNLNREQARAAVRELAPNQRPKTFAARVQSEDDLKHLPMPERPQHPEDAVEVHVLGPKGAALHAWADVEPVHKDLT